MDLNKKLDEWVTQKFISTEQSQAIRTHEEKQPKGNRVLMGIASIGIVALITGVVSIIASNWDFISDEFKLTSYFVIQILLGGAFLRFRHHQGLVRETALSLYALWFVAGIALIAQLYNLQGDGWSVILFWCLLTLPAALIANSRLLPEIWHLAFAYSVLTRMTTKSGEYEIFNAELIVIATSFIFFIVAIMRTATWQFPYYFRRSAQRLSFLAFSALSVIGSFVWVTADSTSFSILEGHYYIIAGLILSILTILYLNHGATKNQKAILSTSLAWITFYSVYPLTYNHPELQIFGCLGFIFWWSLVAALAALVGKARLFDLATLAITVRLIVVYFEVFGSLAATGIGLIISGLVILGLAFSWHYYRRQIMQTLGGGKL